MKKLQFLFAISLFLIAGSVFAAEPIFVMDPALEQTVESATPFENYHQEEGSDIIGETKIIHSQRGQSLREIALEYGLGYRELVNANPKLKQSTLKKGTPVLLPTAYILPPKEFRDGIVINIPEMRLYYFGENNLVQTFPIALGRKGWETPLGDTIVIRKKEFPSWHPPESIRKNYREKKGEELPEIVPPGPDNPLGEFAIYLGLQGYLIHGTNAPSSIGHFTSSGCIRLYNQDIGRLFSEVKRGTKVHIIYYPVKTGISGPELQKLMNDRHIQLPIIFISGHGDVPLAVRAMKAGAVDFLTKPFNDQILLESINKAIRYDSEQRQISLKQHEVKKRADQLTPREYEVMCYIIAGKLNKVISAELNISLKTVEAHRANVMRKMRVKSLPELVELVISNSLCKEYTTLD